jgi:hypothetical protein
MFYSSKYYFILPSQHTSVPVFVTFSQRECRCLCHSGSLSTASVSVSVFVFDLYLKYFLVILIAGPSDCAV